MNNDTNDLKYQSQSASTSASTSAFTIAGIGVQQPIVTAAATTEGQPIVTPAATTEGNDIGNLTREVENNTKNATNNDTGNMSMQQVRAKEQCCEFSVSFCVNWFYTLSKEDIQGDNSACSKPTVDIDLKVAF